MFIKTNKGQINSAYILSFTEPEEGIFLATLTNGEIVEVCDYVDLEFLNTHFVPVQNYQLVEAISKTKFIRTPVIGLYIKPSFCSDVMGNLTGVLLHDGVIAEISSISALQLPDGRIVGGWLEKWDSPEGWLKAINEAARKRQKEAAANYAEADAKIIIAKAKNGE